MAVVGVAIVHHNSPGQLGLCLRSLAAARNSVPLRLVLVENGSTPENTAAAKAAFDTFCAEAGAEKHVYLPGGQNLGFAGGNNRAIRLFLEDTDISHIMLLNSDAVVTEGWLDSLLTADAPMAGPVSNAGGGVQTVFGGGDIPMDDSALPAVAELAARRQALYGGFFAPARMLSFFAVLIRREVWEVMGLLDERFFPGMFEDDDYCLRAEAAGFERKVARGCYVHHWGGQSFEAAGGGGASFEENLKRFEDKWQWGHTPREAEIYEGAIIDVEWLRDKGLMDEAVATQMVGVLRCAQADRANLLANYQALAAQHVAEPGFAELVRQLGEKLRRKITGGGDK